MTTARHIVFALVVVGYSVGGVLDLVAGRNKTGALALLFAVAAAVIAYWPEGSP
jgi:hypothetical protein